jgi:hypothetical protein
MSGAALIAVAARAVISVPITSTRAQAPAATSQALKTPWGEPELQGIWTDEFDTPFQRPAKFANQEYYRSQRSGQPVFGATTAANSLVLVRYERERSCLSSSMHVSLIGGHRAKKPRRPGGAHAACGLCVRRRSDGGRRPRRHVSQPPRARSRARLVPKPEQYTSSHGAPAIRADDKRRAPLWLEFLGNHCHNLFALRLD